MVAERVVSEVYEDYKRLVFQEAIKFVKRYGGDLDDVVAEGNVVFLKVYKAHDPGRGAFSTLLVRSLHNQFMTLLHNRHRDITQKAVRLDSRENGDFDLAATAPDESPGYNLSDLGQDAKTVLDLVLKAPQDLLDAVAKRGGRNATWRPVLRDYLKDVMGWKKKDIENSFDEIGSMLAEV